MVRLHCFEKDPDNVPGPDEPTSSIDLPKALAKAEHWLDTVSQELNEKTETVLALLYATDTVPIRRCALHGDKHKVFAAMIVHMYEQSLQLGVNEYNNTDLRSFGYSMSYMQFFAKADAQFVPPFKSFRRNTKAHKLVIKCRFINLSLSKMEPLNSKHHLLINDGIMLQ